MDITGGEPPTTYRNTIALGLEDARIHALILGYWHTIITPPMVFAKLVSEVVGEYRAKGINIGSATCGTKYDRVKLPELVATKEESARQAAS